jgi:hypothetical protein
MLSTFFALAARSPSRQRTFRRAVTAHAGFVAAVAVVLGLSPAGGTPTTLFGQLLLVAGVVEGALLIGWRLTQLPKSQALEFLLVSPLRPCWVLVAEGLVGLSFLGLVTLAGLPVLALLHVAGLLGPLDVAVMLAMPFTWGAVTGLVLAVWAYEPAGVRRWGERVMVVLVLFYLVVGVLAGERLAFWLRQLPEAIGDPLLVGLIALRDYNPFGMMRVWTERGPGRAWESAVGVEAGALLLVVLLMARAACRLAPHFHERHYRPSVVRTGRSRGTVGERPLTWWAVRRVSEYAGRINLWLAGGFCVLYALYTVAGPQWPQWMGRSVFVLCDRLAGIEGLATALVLLAAVPAAFQYGAARPGLLQRGGHPVGRGHHRGTDDAGPGDRRGVRGSAAVGALFRGGICSVLARGAGQRPGHAADARPAARGGGALAAGPASPRRPDAAGQCLRGDAAPLRPLVRRPRPGRRGGAGSRPPRPAHLRRPAAPLVRPEPRAEGDELILPPSPPKRGRGGQNRGQRAGGQ